MKSSSVYKHGRVLIMYLLVSDLIVSVSEVKLLNMVPIYLLFLLFVSAQESTASWTDMFELCGYSKTCFGSEDHCARYRNCTVGVTARPFGGGVEFEILARPLDGLVAKYVAAGLSFDSDLGMDSVVECVKEEYGPGLYSSLTFQGQAFREENVDYLTLIEYSSAEDTLYCKFRRNEVTTIQGITFDLSKYFHFQVGAGTTVTETSVGPTDIFYDVSVGSVPVDSGAYFLN